MRAIAFALLLGAGCWVGGDSAHVEQAKAPSVRPEPIARDACASTIDGVVDRMMQEQRVSMNKLPADQQRMADDMLKPMVPKMKTALVRACDEDHWSADIRHCLDDAKTMDDGQHCNKLLTAEQTHHLDQLVSAAMGMANDVDSNTDGLPKECDEYKAAIDRLGTCDKVAADAREAMKQAFATAAASWKNLPPDQKAALATGCKAGADAVTQSAKAACGW